MAAADKTATKTIYTTVETPLCFLAFEHCMSASIEGFNDEAIKKRIEVLPKKQGWRSAALCAEIKLTPAPPVKAELKPTLWAIIRGFQLRFGAFKFEATPPFPNFTDSCAHEMLINLP